MQRTIIKFELMMTLECHWGCKDCCRAVDRCYPENSHVTLEQTQRMIEHFKQQNVYISRLKINGGDPVHNPDFEELLWLLFAEVPDLFQGIRVQTAYQRKVIKERYHLPESSRFIVRCEPQDKKHYKAHHVPWFTSPTETGILAKGKDPPFGSAVTKKVCQLQKRCGRSFERWGWTACAQEAVIGRLIGKEVHSQELKLWGDPDICRHCPACLGKEEAKELQKRTASGEFPYISKVFRFDQLKKRYEQQAKRPAW